MLSPVEAQHIPLVVKSLGDAVQRSCSAHSVRQFEARTHVVSSVEEAPELTHISLECIGRRHEIRGRIANGMVLLVELGAALLDLAAD